MYLRFEIVTTINTEVMVLWVVTSCSNAVVYTTHKTDDFQSLQLKYKQVFAKIKMLFQKHTCLYKAMERMISFMSK